MEGEDFTQKASLLNVHPRVLDRLREIVPFEESFGLLTSSNKPEDFWRQIDGLPSAIALELHALAATVPVNDRDFPPDSLTPYFQDFWLARHPDYELTIPAAVTQIGPEVLLNYLRSSRSWQEKNGAWVCAASPVPFSFDNILAMCNAYISEGRPWLFCPIDEVRASYIAFEGIVERAPMTLDLSEIQAKLRVFQYKSTNEFVSDVQGLLGKGVASKLGQFSFPVKLMTLLGKLMKDSEGMVSGQSKMPEGNVNDWIKTRADALVAQMNVPIEKRSITVFTPQVLQARTGQNGDCLFERESLAELLFSNPNGDVMPLPYTNCRAELPTGSPLPHAKSVFRSFVAAQLLKSGYRSATESVMDILTDVVLCEIAKVASDAASKVATLKGGKRDDSDIMMKSLSTIGYDIYAMRMTLNKRR